MAAKAMLIGMLSTIGMLLIAMVCGLLGAYGGAEKTSKLWRRIGVPLLTTITCCWLTWNLWPVFLMLWSIGLGYGIPDEGYPEKPGTDSGSVIGRFWWKVTGKSRSASDIMTRTTHVLYRAMVASVVPIVNGEWMMYILSMFFMFSVVVGFGGDAIIKEEGSARLFGKDLLIEEIVIHSTYYLSAAVVAAAPFFK